MHIERGFSMKRVNTLKEIIRLIFHLEFSLIIQDNTKESKSKNLFETTQIGENF